MLKLDKQAASEQQDSYDHIHKASFDLISSQSDEKITVVKDQAIEEEPKQEEQSANKVDINHHV